MIERDAIIAYERSYTVSPHTSENIPIRFITWVSCTLLIHTNAIRCPRCIVGLTFIDLFQVYLRLHTSDWLDPTRISPTV